MLGCAVRPVSPPELYYYEYHSLLCSLYGLRPAVPTIASAVPTKRSALQCQRGKGDMESCHSPRLLERTTARTDSGEPCLGCMVETNAHNAPNLQSGRTASTQSWQM